MSQSGGIKTSKGQGPLDIPKPTKGPKANPPQKSKKIKSNSTPAATMDLELSRYMSLFHGVGGTHQSLDSDAEQLNMTPLFSWPVIELMNSNAENPPKASQPSSSKGTVQKQSSGLTEILHPLPNCNQYAFMGCAVSTNKAEGHEIKELETALNGVSLDAVSPLVKPSSKEESPKALFLNTDTPWSAFICGSQGSGKSHTLGCMLEGCLINSPHLGKLPNPLAGLVFNYSGSASGICEATEIHSGAVKTTVLCSPANLWKMTELYKPVPGAESFLKVKPLYLQSKHLNIERMWRLMGLSDTEKDPPLYMQTVKKILRSMAPSVNKGSEKFSYSRFQNFLKKEGFTDKQNGPLRLRLDILESFMIPDKTEKQENILAGEPGALTVIDLTDPFLDADTACLLFDICLSEFLDTTKGGKVVALDEAHNYMHKSTGSDIFTEKLLTTVMEQRHNGTRIMIATQEPTISPKLLDLCSMTFVHRFTSPAWFATIKEHIGGASAAAIGTAGQYLMLQEILGLKLGESLLFSPSAAVEVKDGIVETMKLGRLKFKTRPRISHDAGMSKLASRPV